MSREEAIKHLETYSTTNGSGQTTQAQHEEAKQIAIRALENHDTFMKYSYSLGKHDALSQEPTFDDECQKDMDEVWEQIQKKRKRIPVTLDLTPCDDAISREAVYSILKEYHIDEDEIESAMDDCQNLTVNGITSDVSLLPSVTQKSGKWITKPHVYGVTYCSECDFELKINDTNYCPNCGAKMESEDKE